MVPPICGDMGNIREISARCNNYDSIYDLSGEILGQGAYGQVEKITIKDYINLSDESSRPRFWNPDWKDGIIKLMSGVVRSDKIFRMYREAIVSQAISQRLKARDFHLTGIYAYAVDVYSDVDDRDGNIVMQPLAERTLDDPVYQLLFKGEQKMAKLLTKKLLEMALALHVFGGHFHLDIKPSNILVSGNTLIFTDWGTAMPAQQDGTFIFDSTISSGTATYSSPECIRASANRHDGTPLNGEKADVFMIGATVFWLLFGQHHFPADLQHIYVVAFYMVHGYGGPVILADSPPCDAICQIFFNKMLSKESATRMTIQEALDHPWLAEVSTPPGTPSEELDLTIPAEAEVPFDPAGPSESGDPAAGPSQAQEPPIPPQFHGHVPLSLQGPGLFPASTFESLRPHSSPPIPASVLNMHTVASPGLSFGSVPAVAGWQGPVPMPQRAARAQPPPPVSTAQQQVLPAQQQLLPTQQQLLPAQQQLLPAQQQLLPAQQYYPLQPGTYLPAASNVAPAGMTVFRVPPNAQPWLSAQQFYQQQAASSLPGPSNLQPPIVLPAPSNLQQQPIVVPAREVHDPEPLYQVNQGALSMVLPRQSTPSDSPQQGGASSANPVQYHVQQAPIPAVVPERTRSQSEPSSLLAQETLSQHSDEMNEGLRQFPDPD